MAPAAPAEEAKASKKDTKKTTKKDSKEDAAEDDEPKEQTLEEAEAESKLAVEEMLGLSAYEVLQLERERDEKAGNRRASVSRCMYVGKLVEGATEEDAIQQTKAVWDELEAAVEDGPYNHPSSLPDMAVSGLMLAHSNCIVGVFETKCANALDFLAKLETLACLDAKECRVLMCTEDCPKRLFVGAWRGVAVSAKADGFALEEDADEVDVAWDLYQNVLKIYQICERRNERDPMACGAADVVPSADRIRACADSAHDKPWFSLREFLEFFTDPVHIELESDKVWPTQRFEEVTGYLDDVDPDLNSKEPLPAGNEVEAEDMP